MTWLEIIGTCIASVATALGGVWFIVNKSFGAGRFSSRIEEMDKRTCHASCDDHGRAISNIDGDLKAIKNDVTIIKSILIVGNKDVAFFFSMKQSPRRLNEAGEALLRDIQGKSFLDLHKDLLFSLIDSYAPKTALDVETASHAACVSCVCKDIFNGFKDFIYNSPSRILKDANGEEISYDLSIPDICFVLSLPLRDMYLSEHKEILLMT